MKFLLVIYQKPERSLPQLLKHDHSQGPNSLSALPELYLHRVTEGLAVSM